LKRRENALEEKLKFSIEIKRRNFSKLTILA